MCSSRLGAYSRGGGLFRGGGDNSMIYGTEAGTAIWLAGAIFVYFSRNFLINYYQQYELLW